ncbi:hypothetical protein Sste5346_000734 [Sporothrix stenoceras]|uniref:SWIM-type domain-containing protein n=1 Tax=Sporothrix stenoceras TaxID=5173 RepID=A0ABR3ZQ46_9PEZI
MTPVTRSHGHGGEASGSTSGGPTQSPLEEKEDQHSGNETSQDESEENDTDEEDDGPVRSPLTDLFYNVDNLDDETQELVRELFRPPAPEETPPMVIEWCGISNDPDVYAFQLQEVVPRTIRIGSPTSRIPRPSCNCTGTASTPCRHLVWLMDQIAKQTLHDHHPDVPLVLDGASAFPRELPDAYSNISDFHIDILANTLHCGAGPPVTGQPNLHRVRETREILAGLDGVQDDDGVDKYAPEIFDQSKTELESLLWGNERRDDGEEEEDETSDDEDDQMDEDEVDSAEKEKKTNDTKAGSSEAQKRQQRTGAKGDRREGDQPDQIVRDLVERGDLQRTVLRLLVSNDEFFAMFLKLLAPSDKARDSFRKIQQRVETVLDSLLAVKPSTQQQQSRLLMPPPDPRTRRTTSTPSTPTITVTAAESAPLPPNEGNAGVTVAWAAQHVQHAVHQIHLLLQRQLPRPPGERARRSAGRALVWILHALVFFHNRDAHAGATQDDRNLYQRLVGNSDGSSPAKGFFLLDVLAPLHDQTHLRSQLKRIRRRIQVNGYREPYMKRLDEILGLMNAAAEKEEKEGVRTLVPPPTAGSKRHGSNTNTPTDRRPKRMR